jgi:hypothetical protein
MTSMNYKPSGPRRISSAGYIGQRADGTICGGCGICRWSAEAPTYQAFVELADAHVCVPPPPPPPYDPLQSLLREADEALAPINARKFDGNDNYKKCIDIKVAVVGSDNAGAPVFALDAKSPRSAVNNLGMSITWSTNDRAEAAAFLRQLADKIEAGEAS